VLTNISALMLVFSLASMALTLVAWPCGQPRGHNCIVTWDIWPWPWFVAWPWQCSLCWHPWISNSINATEKNQLRVDKTYMSASWRL